MPSPAFEALENRLLLDAAPAFASPLEDVVSFADVAAGKGYTIAIDGYDADGDALTITATSDNPGLDVYVASGSNRFALMHFSEEDGTPIGDILLQLFEERNPGPAERFIQLATGGVTPAGTWDPDLTPFYTDVVVHRVMDDFMIQTGDAVNGNGTGGSGLGDMIDTFGPAIGESGQLSFAGVGVLAFANRGANTSDCQFFITEVPTTWLDGGYMIFGQLISGWDTFNEIIERDPGYSPNRPVPIPLLQSVEIIESPQDGSITLMSPAGLVGAAEVTVTLTDPSGRTAEESFIVLGTPSFGQITNITDALPGDTYQITVPIPYGRHDLLDVTVHNNYGGPGNVVTTIVEDAVEGQYLVTLTLPGTYNGQPFTAAVRSEWLDQPDLAPFTGEFQVRLDSRPVIGGLTDVVVDPGVTTSLDLTVVDGQGDPVDVQAHYDDSYAGVAVSIEHLGGTSYRLDVTVPEGFGHTVPVTLTALEQAYADYADVLTLASRTFELLMPFGIGGSLADRYFIHMDGRGLTVALDGYAADSGWLSYSTNADEIDGLDVLVSQGRSVGNPEGNRYALLSFTEFSGTPIGEILIQLFDERAPTAVGRFITLSTRQLEYTHDDPDTGLPVFQPLTIRPGQTPFYADVDVHYVAQGSMFQTGDVWQGDGTGTSGLGDFTSDVGPAVGASGNLSFSGAGTVAFAVNDNIFMITEDRKANLNDQYPIFGQVISGWDAYDTIVARQADALTHRPDNPPLLASVQIIESPLDATMTILATEEFSGRADLVVTVTDEAGNSVMRVVDLVAIPRMVQIEDIDNALPSTLMPLPFFVPYEFIGVSDWPFTKDIDSDPPPPYLVRDWGTHPVTGEDVIVVQPYDGYDGSVYTVSVYTYLTGTPRYDPEIVQFQLYLGNRPSITNPGRVWAEAGAMTAIPIRITDDLAAGFVVAASTEAAGVGVDYQQVDPGDPEHYEVLVTLPAGHEGTFEVTVTALEAEYAGTQITPSEMTFEVSSIGTPVELATPLAEVYSTDLDGWGLTLGIDGYDPSEDPLELVVTSDDENVSILTPANYPLDVNGNQYARLRFANGAGEAIGEMLVQLFDRQSHNAALRFKNLSQHSVTALGFDGANGTYSYLLSVANEDNPAYYFGTPIDRIVPGVGLWTGDGSGGAGSGMGPISFDIADFAEAGEQGNLGLSGGGVVAFYADPIGKSDDAFFITDGPLPQDNGKYLVFGQIVSGWDVFQSLMASPTDPDGTPLDGLVLETVEIINSIQDGTVTLVAKEGFDGEAEVTVTLTNADGNQARHTFTLLGTARIGEIDDVQAAPGEPVDVEFEVTTSNAGGAVVTATSDYAGAVLVLNPPVEGDTYTLQISLPAEYDGRPFTVTVTATGQGTTNPIPVTRRFTVSLDRRPRISDPGTVFVSQGGTVEVPLVIWDETAGDLTVNVVSAQGSASISDQGDGAYTLTITAPAGFVGVFEVTVTAVESAYVGLYSSVAPASLAIAVSTTVGFATPLAEWYSFEPGGRGLTIGIDGYDANGGPLKIEVTSGQPDALNIYVPPSLYTGGAIPAGWTNLSSTAGNRYAVLHFTQSDGVTSIGDVVIQLLEDRSPAATQRFIQLATGGVTSRGWWDARLEPFYTDVVVHRVIPYFMFQTGDAAKGDGTGRSGLGGIVESFGPAVKTSGNLSFAGAGVVALANAGVGTGTSDCQFFVTEAPTTWLNGQHVIFGQMISGEDVYETIMHWPRRIDPSGQAPDANRPFDAPLLHSVEIIQSPQDGSVTLVANDENIHGPVEVTVTLTNQDGQSVQQTFTLYPAAMVGEAPDLDQITSVEVLPEDQTKVPFQTTQKALMAPELFAWAAWRGERMELTVEPTGQANQYVLRIDPPDDYGGEAFMITVGASLAGAGNAPVSSATFYYTQYGERPVITEIVDVVMAPGGTYSFQVEITDDTDVGLHAETAVQAGGGVEIETDFDVEARTFSITVPEGYWGTFLAALGVVEAAPENGPPANEWLEYTISQFQVTVQPAPGPTLEESLELSGAELVVREDDWLYVASGTQGLKAYYLGNPAQPILRGSYPALVTAVEVLHPTPDRTLLLLGTVNKGLVMLELDFSTAADVFIELDASERRADQAASADANYPIADLVVRGDIVYAACVGYGIATYDISNPADLILLDSMWVLQPTFETRMKYQNHPYPTQYIPHYIDYFTSAAAVAVYGNYAYVADQYQGWFAVIDVRNPARLAHVRVVDIARAIWDMEAQDGVLYLAASDGLRVYSLTIPSAPRGGGYYKASWQDWFRQNYWMYPAQTQFLMQWQWPTITMMGKTAVVATQDGFEFVDVSDPRRPIRNYRLVDRVGGGTAGVRGTDLILPLTGGASWSVDAASMTRTTCVQYRQTILDENGIPVTFLIAGGGFLRVHTSEVGGGRIELVEVVGSTVRTNVVVITPRGRTTTIETIRSSGPLVGFNAATATLAGDAFFEGGVRYLALARVGEAGPAVRREHLLRIGAQPAFGRYEWAALRLGSVRDLRIDSGMPLYYVLATEWLDDETNYFTGENRWSDAQGQPLYEPDDPLVQESDLIVAPLLRALYVIGGRGVAGDFQADLQLEGYLFLATVAGDVSGAWSADYARLIIVRGDADGWTLRLAMPADAAGRTYALYSMAIYGWLRDSRVLAAGNIASIVVGGMYGAYVYAGYLAADPDAVTGLPAAGELGNALLFDPLARIRALSVRGILAPNRTYQQSFINSSIAAANLGIVYLSHAQWDNVGVKFGLAARTLVRFSYRDVGIRWYTWPNLSEPIGPRAFGDLITRLV